MGFTAKQQRLAMEIAAKVRAEYWSEFGYVESLCKDVSNDIMVLLKAAGTVCRLECGFVEIDEPDPECFEDGQYMAVHFWVEIGGPNGWVVDATADQFNHMIRGETFPQIIVSQYKDLPRHNRGR